MKRLHFSARERARGELALDTLALGQHVIERDGVLVIQDAFSRTFVDTLRREFFERHPLPSDPETWPGAVAVGDRRFMMSVRLEPPFRTPRLYANPLLTPLLTALLGQDCVLGSFGAVVSLPGSADQHVHRDHPPLFGDSALSAELPCYAIQLLVPLVALNGEHGTTRVWKGSHRVSEEAARRTEPEDLMVPVGSCALTDYRVLHGGTANQSSRPRPVLYLMYQRPWFRDHVNFRRQYAIEMSASELRRVPKRHRGWFMTASVANAG